MVIETWPTILIPWTRSEKMERDMVRNSDDTNHMNQASALGSEEFTEKKKEK